MNPEDQVIADIDAFIDEQLAALNDGVDRIESEVVGGAARSLDVQREFLRTRLGTQQPF